jgi:hypothetical protein
MYLVRLSGFLGTVPLTIRRSTLSTSFKMNTDYANILLTTTIPHSFPRIFMLVQERT